MHPFTQGILQWYRANARDLPWRQTKDPYAIWLSEVILQQTRVEQGLPYYQRLLSAFPNVQALADAPDQVLMRHWQGLGYYSRARNLQRSARYIAYELKGQFPKDYAGWLALPGVGPYTAAAIVSFAFNQAHAVVDGNVLRVLARYFGLDQDIALEKTKKTFQALAQELLQGAEPALFNQAIMEWGAMQCKPQALCMSCPLQASCLAYAQASVDRLPVKTKKIQKRTRFFHYFLIENQGKVFLRQRGKGDIWTQLWEFTLVEGSQAMDLEGCLEMAPSLALCQGIWEKLIAPKAHVLSHQRIQCQAWKLSLTTPLSTIDLGPGQWVAWEDLDQFALPQLLLNLLHDNL